MNPDEDTDSTRVDEGHNNRENIYTDQTINSPDQHGNVPLHNAVIHEDVQMLNDLLHHSAIDINFKNHVMGETPLQLALRMSRPYSIIMQLIRAGSDVNAVNKFKQNSIHLALLYSSVEILHELIKNGADINAQDQDQETPLYYAVNKNNMEAVCMLLYYGADASISNDENKTAFTFALEYNMPEIAEVLFNYYDDFSDCDDDGYTALHRAILHQIPLAVDLVKMGVDVNCITNYNENVLTMSLNGNSSELFELIWPKFNHKLLLNERNPFLPNFILPAANFAASNWLKLMYLVLESPIAFELVQDARIYFANTLSNNSCVFDILLTFHNLSIALCDRIKIISICLSLGYEIDIYDISFAYMLYGFNMELEMLLYCAEYCPERYCLDLSGLFPQCQFIFSKHDCLVTDNVMWSFWRSIYVYVHKYSKHVSKNKIQNCIIYNLAFYSFPFNKKQELFEMFILDNFPAVYEALEALPEVPSLLELSRNETCNLIRRTCKITKAYQFHDIVKKLNLPGRLRDIVCFKMPLYRHKLPKHE